MTTEDLTVQINGVTDTFTTSKARRPGSLEVCLDGVDLWPPPTYYHEVDTTVFQLSRIPNVGEELVVSYFTSDEIGDHAPPYCRPDAPQPEGSAG